MRIEHNGQWTEVPKECLSGISFGADGLALSGDEAGLGIYLTGKSTDKDEHVNARYLNCVMVKLCALR
jgi:hypothetical protein